MPADSKQIFLKEYTRALREGSAAMFVGAGVSRAAGYVDWKQLLKEIAEELDLDIDREADLVAVAQYHVNFRRGRDRINQLLIEEFLEGVELTESHRAIASLPIHTVWTTNYDDLLERAFDEADKRSDVKRHKEDFSTTRRRADVTIHKMHGDKTYPAGAVLTKDDYERYHTTHEVFTIALKSDLATKTFLFVGFGFSDPNVLYILGRNKLLLESNSRKHYCIIREPNTTKRRGGTYERNRFKHWLADLERYNIQPILIKRYEEVPELLFELNRRSHLRDVFISGSAADYSPLGEPKFRELCQRLGTELISKNFNIISGYGSGVADAVIFGAMQSLKRNDDERLQLWPMPQKLPSGIDRDMFWRNYRERIMAGAGVCVVLAGNKTADGQTIPADGVLEEVKLATSHGKPVIPIGVSGHVAKEIWDQARNDLKSFFGSTNVASPFAKLGDESASPKELVEATIQILKRLET